MPDELDARIRSKASREAGQEALRYLRKYPTGTSFEDIRQHCERAGVKSSEPTVRRGLDWLRLVHDCPLTPEDADNTWTLHDHEFSLPLDDPTHADLTAAIFARALMGPMVSSAVEKRLQRLVEEMDARINELDANAKTPSPNAVAASLTTGTPIEPRLLSTLLKAISERLVLHLEYYSPWGDYTGGFDVEPWQVRVHDGTMYLRGWSRGVKDARNFRVVQVKSARVLEGETPRGDRPQAAKLWGDDPGVGVDDDRPDSAVVRIRGAFARWVSEDRWHAAQHDEWIEKGELLQRTVPYRSCRELARRLLTLGDSLVSVEPKELREEVNRHVASMHQRLSGE